MTETASQLLVPPAKQDIFQIFADRYHLDPDKVATTLKATAFKSDTEVTNEQMVALLIVADQYRLNPWTKEIYAFPDKKGGIVPVVSVDGWARIINERSELDGIEFNDSANLVQIGDSKPCPDSIECVIYRNDRNRPTKIREYIDECYRNTGPWQSHTKRMLRHKALIQCARIAFGFGGIYDQDEAERILSAENGKVIDGNATRVATEAIVIEGPRTIHQENMPRQEEHARQDIPPETAPKSAEKAQAEPPKQPSEGKPGPSAHRTIAQALRRSGYVDSEGEVFPPTELLDHFSLESLDDVSSFAMVNEIVNWLAQNKKK